MYGSQLTKKDEALWVGPYSAQYYGKNGWETVYSGFASPGDARMSFASSSVFPDSLKCRVVDSNGEVVFQ